MFVMQAPSIKGRPCGHTEQWFMENRDFHAINAPNLSSTNPNSKSMKIVIIDTSVKVVRIIHFNELRKHNSVEHSKIYKCPKCSSSFKRSRHLDEHLQSKHESTRSFICTHCPSPQPKFAYKRNLNAHIMTSHEGFYFPCYKPGCPAKFSSNQRLQRHIEKHQEIGTKPRVSRSRIKPDSPLPKRIKEDAWETDSQSSIIALLNAKES
ncbi:hypothetical protein Ciccas_007995 [Cichlidogyrus casuarinus]|uniref:C2H2-type domain-containing protein n=1 Tax=Cichlidogyrus casuarinus TaxID=1844966 RepID=A0ABD2Q217_9PLAT